MSRREMFLIGGIIIVFGFVAVFYVTNFSRPKYQTAPVKRGPIVQEVLASGSVQSPTTINLHFKNSGKIAALNAVVGRAVSAGDVLARQDTSILSAQRDQAQAAVDAADAALHKLQTGATPQSVAVSKAALDVARQALQNSYASAQSTLSDAYAKANDAVASQLAPFFSGAQSINPQLTFSVSDSQIVNDIVSQRVQAGLELGSWWLENLNISNASDAKQLDQSLVKADAHLTVVQSLMNVAVTAVANNVSLSSTNATTYRASASTGLSEVNAAIAEIRALEQAIASQNAAIAQAQAQLDLIVAPSTQNDLDAQRAAVTQARANLSALNAQTRDLEIMAPVSGIITDTNGEVGEIATPDKTIVTIMPKSALQVKVNVSEDNIVNVKPGDHARIELDAFPSGTEFSGSVSEIDPAQTIVGGAVYYQATLLFDQDYSGIRPGMSVNVWIATGSAPGALTVPASALQRNGTSTSVEVLKNGTATRRVVTTGLKGQNGMVEITSGVEEGDLVVTGTQ